MKLFEIFGRGLDRGVEQDWRDQMQQQAAARQQATAHATQGYWLISREGKRLAGPFSSEANANNYKTNRPDRIPANAVVKPM